MNILGRCRSYCSQVHGNVDHRFRIVTFSITTSRRRDTLSHVKGLCFHHCLHRNLWLAKQTSNSSNFKYFIWHFDWCKVKTNKNTYKYVRRLLLRYVHTACIGAPRRKSRITVSPHDNNHTDQLFKCTYESRQAHNSIMNLSVSHASRQSHCQHNMLNSSELPCQQGSHRSSIMTPPAPNAVFTKILGHFRQLVPNVRWEISQIWIQYKPIRHMSDEPWSFHLHCKWHSSRNLIAGRLSHPA